MSDLSDILNVMAWPAVACLLLPGILVYMGLHIVRREIIFVDLALAQVAALGTCVAILLGHHDQSWDIHLPFSLPAFLVTKGHAPDLLSIPVTYLWSLSFTIIGAGIFTLTRNQSHHHVPQEALIGIVYVVAAALGILLLSKNPEGNEELRRTLIGDLLVVQSQDVWRTFGIYFVVGLVHFIFRRQFITVSFQPERAVVEKLAVRWWDFLFYALFGVVVTSFVQIGGVLLVFSYLIVPAVCANFLANKLASLLIVGWITATISSVIGLFFSARYDYPTGAAIVCTLGAALLVCGAFARIRDRVIAKKGARQGSDSASEI